MVKKALLVATNGLCFQPVFGIPAIRRLVLLARQLGYGEIHVISNGEPVFPVLGDLVPSGALHSHIDASSLSALAAGLGFEPDDPVLVMAADRVIDARSLQKLTDTGNGSCLGGSGDAGICMVRPSMLAPVLKAMWSPQPASAGEAASDLPMRLTDPSAAKAAESALARSLRSATGEHEYGFLSRHVGRALSRPLSGRLAKTRISPNTVTFGNVLIGLIGAFFLARGGYRSQLLGSLLFLSSVILDGVDGEVARLKVNQTVFGHYLDIIGDNIVHVAVFVGIGLGLYRETGSVTYLHALWFLLGGFGLCAWAVQRLIGHEPDQPSVSDVSWFTALLVNRDFAYLVVLLAAINRLDWFLFGTSLGVYLFAFIGFLMSTQARGRRKDTALEEGIRDSNGIAPQSMHGGEA